MAALRTVFLRSPIAEMKTEAKVAGTSPPYSPNSTKASTPPRMHNQPRHSGPVGAA